MNGNTMRRKLKIDTLAKVLSSVKRVKILLIIDKFGPLRYSELMEKLEVKNSGELNYHLSLLKEAGMVTLDVEGGQRRYTLTSLGEKTIDFLKELGSILVSRTLGLYIIDELGIAYDYDATKLVNTLKREYNLSSRQAKRVLRDLENTLLDLNLVFYKNHEISQIILATLLKNKLKDSFIKNTVVGFRSGKLSNLLENASYFEEFAEKLSKKILLTYNVYNQLPNNVRTLLQTGVFYVSHLDRWPFGFEEIILNTPLLTYNMNSLLDFLNHIFLIKDLSYIIYLRSFNEAIYKIYRKYGKNYTSNMAQFISKTLKAICLIRANLKYNRFAIEITTDKYFDEESYQFTKTLLNQLYSFKKIGNPSIIINIKSLREFKRIESILYNLVLNHVPITLINNVHDTNAIYVPPFVLDEKCKETIVVENVFNMLLPVLFFYARESRSIAEDFLSNVSSSLVEIIEKKRKWLHKKMYFQKLYSYTKNRMTLVNILSVLGGELATEIIMGKFDVSPEKINSRVIKILSSFCNEISKLTKTKINNLEIAFSSTDLNLYEYAYRAISYKIPTLAFQNLKGFNLQSPFSKTRRREFRKRVAIEESLYKYTNIPSIFTIEFSTPFPTFDTFEKLTKMVLDSKVKIISFSFDYTKCAHCGYVASEHVSICPSCSSVYPFITHYGRFILDYQPLKHLPILAVEEYRNRTRMNEVSLRNEL